MNAYEIVRALAVKHKDDVFIDECTIHQNGGRFDGWAMKKSWAHPICTGYEIKVARSDFINDGKWTKYLDFCNAFYFVCPDGSVMDKAEVPESAGLMYVTNTGRVYTKKKAPYRIVSEGNLAMMYKRVLMNRAKILPESHFGGNFNEGSLAVEYWEKMLEKKEESRVYGHRLAGKIRHMYDDKIRLVDNENRELKTENRDILRSFSNIKKMVEEMGIDPLKWNTADEVRKRLLGGDSIYNIFHGMDRISKEIARCMESDKELVDAIMNRKW